MCVCVCVCVCVWVCVGVCGCLWYRLSRGGVEGQWVQCATPGLAPIPLDQPAWGLRWDLHVLPVQGGSYSPQKSDIIHTDKHISYLKFSHIHIQTHTYTYIHIHTHTYHNRDIYMQYRHDTDIYIQIMPA